MPEGGELTSQTEAEGSSRRSNPALPSPRHENDIGVTRSEALSPDEIGEVRRELTRLGEQLRAGESERDRLIEQVRTQQAKTHNLLNHRHADAIEVLKDDYEAKLETLRTEHAEAIATLKSEHAEAVATLKSEHATTIASLKTEIRNQLQAVTSSLQ
jgi:molecular chaperone DnaK (HSP70)